MSLSWIKLTNYIIIYIQFYSKIRIYYVNCNRNDYHTNISTEKFITCKIEKIK